MELTALIYVEGEWNPSLFCQNKEERIPIYEIPAEKMENTFSTKDAGKTQKPAQRKEWLGNRMRDTLEAGGLKPEEVLLIAATDVSAQAAGQLGLAMAGYVNPCFPGQSFPGVPMVIEGFEEVDLEFLDRIYRRCHGLPWTIAVTDRCLLREMTVDDLDDLICLYEQPGITWRETGNGKRVPGFIEPLFPREEEKRYQEAYISNMYGYYGYGMWAVIHRKTGKLIGRAGLEHREYASGVELELGYLIHPHFQHRGIATEVCNAILTFAGENLDFPRINALTDPQNHASAALLGKLGFVYLEDTFVTGSRMQRYIRNLNLLRGESKVLSDR